MDENIWPKKNVCLLSKHVGPQFILWIYPPPPQKKKLRDELPTVIKVTIKMLQERYIFIIYCRSGNFRVLKFPRISDFGPFHEV